MATRAVTVLVCDYCQEDGDDVKTHSVAVDRWAREVDVCSGCWSEIAQVLDGVKAAGRRPRVRA